MISFVLLSVFVASAMAGSQRYRVSLTAMDGSRFFVANQHAALVTVNINGENCIAPFMSGFVGFAERPCGWGLERSQEYVTNTNQPGLLYYSPGQRNLFGFGNPASAGLYANTFWQVATNFAKAQPALLGRVTNAEIDLRLEYSSNAARVKTVLGRNAAGEQLGTRPGFLSTDNNAAGNTGFSSFTVQPFDKCFLVFDNNGASGRPNSFDFIGTGLYLTANRPVSVTSPSVVFGFWSAAQAGSTTNEANFFNGAAVVPTVTPATGTRATELTTTLGTQRNGGFGIDAFGIGTARPLFDAAPTGTGDITNFVGATTGLPNYAAAIWPLTYQSSAAGRNDRVLQACFIDAGACHFHPVASLSVSVCVANFAYFE